MIGPNVLNFLSLVLEEGEGGIQINMEFSMSPYSAKFICVQYNRVWVRLDPIRWHTCIGLGKGSIGDKCAL